MKPRRATALPAEEGYDSNQLLAEATIRKPARLHLIWLIIPQLHLFTTSQIQISACLSDLKGWKMDVTYGEGSRSHNPIRHWTSRYRQESIILPWNSNNGRRVAACANWRRDEGSYSTKATSNTYESYNYQDFCSKIDYCQRKIGSLTYITAIAEAAFGVSMFPRFHESIQTLVLIIIMQRTRYWRSIEF